MLKETYTLRNGVEIPKLGFGTWQIEEGEDAYNAVKTALEVGYRHIDTAQGYGNEKSVGRAIEDSGVPREEVFVTSKLEAHIKDYEGAKKACAETLKRLDMDYIDLFIIHAPWPWGEMGKDCDEGNVEAYRALEDIYKAKKARAIGVSNFEVKHLQNILKNNEIVPHVNQIGYFIGIDQSKTIDFCRENDIFVEAYSPLGIGFLLENETVQNIAKKYGKTPAQICIRYLLEKGVSTLPKSVHKNRMIENSEVDFKIADDDMKTLDAIEGDPRRWDEIF